ncbi:MAG: hypothetical protein QF406_14920 [Verrucomicrobiota bacterium]|jgi:hypothetical protein|nr:hypothetical protein [Verrucomicrobiota bacterium]
MAGANKTGVNNPDPNKPWCSKCRGHTEFTEEEGTRSSSEGSYTVTIRKCVGCNKEIYAPYAKKKSFLHMTIMCFAVFIGLYLLLLYISGLSGDESEKEAIGLLIKTLPVICVGSWLQFTISNGLFYLKWKRWATELGWGKSE